MSVNIKKLFFNGAWSVGWRFIDDKDEGILDSDKKFNIILPTQYCWYADPFPFKKDNKYYIFLELFNRRLDRGTIGVCSFEDNKITEVKEIIKESFHLSYPNIFEYENEVYMIPETYESNQLRLYKCTEFPYKWELDCILKNNITVVDTTILEYKDNLLLLTYDIEKEPFYPRRFILDMKSKSLTEYEFEKIEASNGRPGGNYLKIGKDYFHPIQGTCSKYFSILHIYKIEKLQKNYLSEVKIKTLTPENINRNKNKRFERIHTFNRCDNLETIDLYYDKFYFSKIFYKIYEKINSIINNNASKKVVSTGLITKCDGGVENKDKRI